MMSTLPLDGAAGEPQATWGSNEVSHNNIIDNTINTLVIRLLLSKVSGSGDHPLLPQVEVLTSLSPLHVKVSMDPPIVTGGVLVMVTIAAVDGVGHTTVREGVLCALCTTTK